MRPVILAGLFTTCVTLAAMVQVAHAGWKCGPGGQPTATGCKCPSGKQPDTNGADHVCKVKQPSVRTPPLTALPPPPSPPQLESPSDGARDIKTTTPFTASPPAWADELEVELCRDEGCVSVLRTKAVAVANGKASFVWDDLPAEPAMYWRSRSRQNGQPRGPYSAARGFSPAARTAYLTITVAPERQVQGLVIKRDGLAIARGQWDTPLAVDPGDHVVEASAPGFQTWSTTQTLGMYQKAGVIVAALVATPTIDQPPGTVTPPRSIAAVRPFAIGLAIGTTRHADDDIVFGGRLGASFAIPHGALRVLGSVLYANDTYTGETLYRLGFSADYVWMPLPYFAFGVGLGIGRDYGTTDPPDWWTLRASPLIARFLNGRVEAGLHVQYLRRDTSTFVLGLAAIDLFPL
jgi:hypothetical protein